MNHTETLNYIIQKKNYNSYLEIGTEYGINFDNININFKECCDIDNSHYDKITYSMSSDEMFAKMDINQKYDIIFIDGMHDEEFVDRDIINSLKHLNPGGMVCVHDVIPYASELQVKYECFHGGAWTGDVWKSITKLQNNNLEFYTICNDEDFGLTVIKYKENPYSLIVPQYKSNIRYEYVFNDTFSFDTCISKQGKYVLHCISEDEIDSVL